MQTCPSAFMNRREMHGLKSISGCDPLIHSDSSTSADSSLPELCTRAFLLGLDRLLGGSSDVCSKYRSFCSSLCLPYITPGIREQFPTSVSYNCNEMGLKRDWDSITVVNGAYRLLAIDRPALRRAILWSTVGGPPHLCCHSTV